MSNIELTKSDMLDILESGDGVVCDIISGTGRWRINHTLVFRREGVLYLSYYSVGSTEYQDESPWEDDEVVTCYEAEEVPTVSYVRKK